MQRSPNPFPVDEAMLKDAFTWPRGPISTMSVYGNLYRGDIVMDRQRKARLIIGVLSGNVLYVSAGHPWIQTVEGFVNEVITAPFVDVWRRTKPIKEMLEISAEFADGVISSTTLSGFLTINGTELVQFILKHKEDFPRWINAMKLFLRLRRVLKKHAPQLYQALVRTAIGEILKRIPENINPVDIAKFLGSLFGVIAKAKIKTSLQVVITVLKVLTRAISPVLSAAVRAGNNVFSDLNLAAKKIQDAFQQHGIKLSVSEALQIAKECAYSRGLIRAALKDLQMALETLQR